MEVLFLLSQLKNKRLSDDRENKEGRVAQSEFGVW